MMKRHEAAILFQRGPFWVTAATEYAGFDVWLDGPTCARRVARIGYQGDVGLEKAKLEIARRVASDPWLDC